MYFVHEVRGFEETVAHKGIVACETLDNAKQAFHAYMGAYAYSHDPDGATFVSCMVTDKQGNTLMAETWNKITK